MVEQYLGNLICAFMESGTISDGIIESHLMQAIAELSDTKELLSEGLVMNAFRRLILDTMDDAAENVLGEYETTLTLSDRVRFYDEERKDHKQEFEKSIREIILTEAIYDRSVSIFWELARRHQIAVRTGEFIVDKEIIYGDAQNVVMPEFLAYGKEDLYGVGA